MSTPEARLAELGIKLPKPPAPAAAYAPTVRTGPYIYIAGQLPLVDGQPAYEGRLGDGVTIDQATQAARRCAINLLAVLKAELGDLSRVKQVVRLTGFVASAPAFHEQHKVVNGASELLGEVFGEAGKHTRSAVGVAVLPFDVPVEIDAIVEVE